MFTAWYWNELTKYFFFYFLLRIQCCRSAIHPQTLHEKCAACQRSGLVRAGLQSQQMLASAVEEKPDLQGISSWGGGAFRPLPTVFKSTVLTPLTHSSQYKKLLHVYSTGVLYVSAVWLGGTEAEWINTPEQTQPCSLLPVTFHLFCLSIFFDTRIETILAGQCHG